MASDIGDSNGTQDSGTYDPNQPISVLGGLPMPSQWSVGPPDSGLPSVLGDALNPPPWTLADSSLNFFVDPDTMKTIDFGRDNEPGQAGSAPPDQNQPPQPDNGGFYGLTPYQPGGTTESPSPSDGGNGWMQLDPPQTMEAGEHGSGYYIYGTDKTHKQGTDSNAQWGTQKTVQVIGAVADKLATGDQYTPFGVGNISLPGGQDFHPDHSGHRDGLGIDVRPARTDGGQAPVSYQNPQYDRDATQRLVDAFRSTGQVSKIYFNDPRSVV